MVLGTEKEPLKPDTTYYYRCGKEGREKSFKTLPDKFPLNVAIVGERGHNAGGFALPFAPPQAQGVQFPG